MNGAVTILALLLLVASCEKYENLVGPQVGTANYIIDDGPVQRTEMIMRIANDSGQLSGTWALAEDPPDLPAIGGIFEGNVEEPIRDGSVITFTNFDVTFPCFAVGDASPAIAGPGPLTGSFSVAPCGIGNIWANYSVEGAYPAW
jgi:hypothetical protein